MSARQYGSSFGFSKSDRSQTNVVCKLCNTIVPGKTGSTTNVFNHRSRSHPLEHSRIKKRPTTSANATLQKQQQTTLERYSASVPYYKASKRYKDITQAVAYHIAKDMLPLSTVEKPVIKISLTCLQWRFWGVAWGGQGHP